VYDFNPSRTNTETEILEKVSVSSSTSLLVCCYIKPFSTSALQSKTDFKPFIRRVGGMSELVKNPLRSLLYF